MFPTWPPPTDAAPIAARGIDQADGRTVPSDECRGVLLGVNGHGSRIYFETEGRFLLATMHSSGLERDLHRTELTVWTPTGAIYEGWGRSDTEGRWPKPPTTFTATAKVTNVLDATDTRSVVCRWVRPLDGRDTVIVEID